MAMNPYGSFQGGRPQGPQGPQGSQGPQGLQGLQGLQGPPGTSPMGGRPMAPSSSSGPYSGMLPFAPPPTSGYSSAPPPPLLGRPPFGALKRTAGKMGRGRRFSSASVVFLALVLQECLLALCPHLSTR